MSFKLPDGRITKSQAIYIREWRKLTRFLDAQLGLETIGFDPSVLVRDVGTFGPAFELPVWFVHRLMEKSK